tara:strand:+ start:810 stop:1766 length:957 start_codon:yes stop_codon:yes gene_type:complete
MSKKLIIGGSGFIGQNVLNQSDLSSFINFDKNESKSHSNITIIGNILNVDELESVFLKHEISEVVLLAAEHKDNVEPKELYYDVNVNGTKNVLKLMTKYNVNNLLFTSSVAVYGLNKINPNEQHKLDPFHDYGVSKHLAEKEIKRWFLKDQNRSVTIIRPVVVFGEENRGNVYNLFKQISERKFIMIGNGDNKKSMAYVENVSAFIRHNLNSESGFEVYNYSDYPDLSMNELVQICEDELNIKIPKIKIPYHIGLVGAFFISLIFKIFGKTSSINTLRVKKFCATTQFDSSKAHNTSFKPNCTMTDAIKKTINKEFTL